MRFGEQTPTPTQVLIQVWAWDIQGLVELSIWGSAACRGQLVATAGLHNPSRRKETSQWQVLQGPRGGHLRGADETVEPGGTHVTG